MSLLQSLERTKVMTSEDKKLDADFAEGMVELASMILHGTEFISEGSNHRQVIMAMVLAAYRYADKQRDCCMLEGPAIIVSEALAMIAGADKEKVHA